MPERDPDHPEARSRDEKAHTRLGRMPMVPMPKRQSRWEENKRDRARRAQSTGANLMSASSTNVFKSNQVQITTDQFYRMETSIKHDDRGTFDRVFVETGLNPNDTPYCRVYNVDGVEFQEVSLGNGHKAMMGKKLKSPYLTQKFCMPCLHFAASRNAVNVVRYLLQQGAFPAVQTYPGGQMATELAGSPEIDRIFRVTSASNSELPWVCKLCSKRNEGKAKKCLVCGRANDHELSSSPKASSPKSGGGGGVSPTFRMLLSGRLPRFRNTNGENSNNVDPRLLSAMHEPAPSPKHRVMLDDNDDAIAALLIEETKKMEESTKKEEEKKTKKTYTWAKPGQQARILSGEHNGKTAKIMEVLGEFKALLQITSSEEEAYVEISRHSLQFIGPWQCLVCYKKNESKVQKCGVCGRPRGHETPDEVIQRVWNPKRTNSVFSSSSPRNNDQHRKRRQTTNPSSFSNTIIKSPPRTNIVKNIAAATTTTSTSSENDDSGTCCIRLEKPSTHAFVPCGHKCVCKACGDAVMKCPHCRGPKAMLIKIFQ